MPALYRTYRPQTFSAVLGQEHAVNGLRTAAARGQLGGRAFLLAGPSGTGKTTLARLVAKVANCKRPKDGEPCRRCRSCKAYVDAGDPHRWGFIVQDAAADRGIAAIRKLRHDLGRIPLLARHRVDLLDEAHALTSEAQDALLGLLEELPEHATLVLATTRLDFRGTFLSRCQRFPLKRLDKLAIRARLADIAEAEGRDIDGSALDELARRARGNMRDGIQMLEQHFTGTSVRTLAPIPRESKPTRKAGASTGERGRPDEDALREKAIMDVLRDGERHSWSEVRKRAKKDAGSMKKTRDRLEGEQRIEVRREPCGVMLRLRDK